MPKRVGVLVFSDSRTIHVGRDGRSNYSFDGLGLSGIGKIAAEIEGGVDFCSPATMDEYDFVLVSLTSFHDLLSLSANVPVKRRAKVVVGGPACNNINPIMPYIDVANFGRCDSGKINRVLSGESIPSVWRKSDDPDFSGQYEVDASNSTGLGADEGSFGCSQKCFFCFYSWWNGHVTKNADSSYRSGFGDHEDFFQSLKWDRAIRGAVTALDGVTQAARFRVGKPISTQDIKDVLLKSNEVDSGTLLRVKIYGILGYPWERQNELDKFDLIEAVKDVEPFIRKKILLKMHFSHFIPFQKTPLWASEFNWNDYREWCQTHQVLFRSDKISVYSGGTYMPSPSLAAVSTVLQRIGNDGGAFCRIAASKKFQSASSIDKERWLKKTYPGVFAKQDRESIPNVKTPWKFDKPA
ncbi:MAG: hypothetical protein WC343_00665 [Bacilli bacterium]|jgi:hypothetical protein